jgi:hypothetical protein
MRNFYRALSLTLLLIAATISHSQKPDSTLTLNSLKSPVSPGATLLGINSSEIQKPTDLTGLLVSVRNATNDFTTIPSSFAVDIAPKWLFDRKGISLQDYFSNKIGKNISQTFLLSYAQALQKDDNYDGLKQGVGFKFSLCRGKITDKKYINTISKIRDLHKKEFDLEDDYKTLHGPVDSTAEFKKLQFMLIKATTDDERRKINQQMEDLEAVYNNERAAVINEQMREQYADVVKLEETITPVRKGFILDFSAGTIVKYDSSKINASSLTNSSVWLTIGYDGFKTDTADNSYFSILGLSRLVIDNADELYKSGVNERYTSWDNGVRLGFNTASQKFAFSGEIISRRLFNTPSAGKKVVTKYLFSVELQIGKNQRLSFSYGRDFENRITKDGNVIGLLNFVTGFFNKKTFTPNTSAE